MSTRKSIPLPLDALPFLPYTAGMSRTKRNINILTGRAGAGSPIESRSQARGIVECDRRKRASKNRCRRKGRQGGG